MSRATASAPVRARREGNVATSPSPAHAAPTGAPTDAVARPGTATLVAIVPVHNGGDDIARSLDALLAAGQPVDALVVVDDASTDGRAEAAASARGTRYLRLDGGPFGPARARNAGAALFPRAGAYLFVDADVTVHTGVVRAFAALLEAEPDVAAAFGSYDDAPPAHGWISRYKNLVHHWMHQRGASEACTFWSGCGVVRGDAFRRHGGFDEGFAAASIEDVDLGLRLSDAGARVRLDPTIQCTHWKRWTLGSWLRTDILARALPWSRLLVSRSRGVPDTLNLGLAERVSAVLACLALACLALAAVALALALPALGAFAATAALLVSAGFCLLQRRLIGFFARTGGAGFAVAATLMHATYFVYSSVVYGAVVLGSLWRRPAPGPAGPSPRRDDRAAATPTSTAFAAGSSSRKSNGTR